MVDGHNGLALHTRGDGNGSWLVRYRVHGKRQWHTLHNDARRAVFADVVAAKDKWLAAIKLVGVDPKLEMERQRAAAITRQRTVAVCFEAWLDHTGKRRSKAIAGTTIWGQRFKMKVRTPM
jgi:hypothetical protein